MKAIFKLGNILIPAINIHLGKDRQQFNLYFSETLAQPIGGSRGQHGAIISFDTDKNFFGILISTRLHGAIDW